MVGVLSRRALTRCHAAVVAHLLGLLVVAHAGAAAVVDLVATCAFVFLLAGSLFGRLTW